MAELFRAMIREPDGLPRSGQSARELGIRLGVDIPVIGDTVVPGTGGQSVTPGNPVNLPYFRRPKSLCGTGKDPVSVIDTGVLPALLRYRADPAQPAMHGFLEPAAPMSVSEFQKAIEDTRSNWKLCDE